MHLLYVFYINFTSHLFNLEEDVTELLSCYSLLHRELIALKFPQRFEVIVTSEKTINIIIINLSSIFVMMSSTNI